MHTITPKPDKEYKYDNYGAIKVGKVAGISCDYFKEFIIPAGALSALDPSHIRIARSQPELDAALSAKDGLYIAQVYADHTEVFTAGHGKDGTEEFLRGQGIVDMWYQSGVMEVQAYEVINLICAVVGVAVTIAIGLLQCWQNAKINKLSCDQMKAEQRLHNESVDVMVRKFLLKYHETIGLLPLCAIAASYNDAFPYSRKMYFDFILLPMDVRAAIFSQCGWKMCEIKDDRFFWSCLVRLEKASETFLPNSKFLRIFYDNGKHIERAINGYKSFEIPDSYSNMGNLVSDIVHEAVQTPESGLRDAYSRIIEEMNFQAVSNNEASMIACCTAISVARYSGCLLPENDSAANFGSPGSWNGERIETMEDLFLLTLFEIWRNLWDIEDRLLLKASEEYTSVHQSYDH